MATPPRQELLAAPVRSDADVLARVGAIIGENARRLRSLWLFFLHGDGVQGNVIVPIEDVPELPDPSLVNDFCFMAARAVAVTAADGRAVITLTRPGAAMLAESDLLWLAALREGAASHEAPVRMFCLATPCLVRELSP
ncbi:MAG TPA: hypothetical protein VF060_28270 [Trebonia sp.]